MNVKINYDVCIITFSDIEIDARVKNLIDCLIHLQKKVLVISIESASCKQTKNLNFDNIEIKLPLNRRLFWKWLAFKTKIKSIIHNYTFDIIWCADLYSLPTISNSNKVLKIYDSREIYSKLSTLNQHKLKQRIITWIEKWYIRQTDVIVTSGKLDSEYLKQFYCLTQPIYEVFNYPPKKEFIASNVIREKFNIPQEKIIQLYQGVLLPGRGIIPVINATAKNEQLVFVILGDGPAKKDFINYTEKIGVSDRVKFLGNVDYDSLHQWTCAADIGMCNIEPISFSYQLALPNKLFEYIQAELPVIITDLPALKEIVNELKCGEIISTKNETKEIINAIEKNFKHRNEIKNNIRLHKNKFVYENQYPVIEEIIKKTL